MSLVCGSCTEREKASVDMATGVAGPDGRERERAEVAHPEALSTDAALAGGPARISGEAPARWGGGGAKGPAHQDESISINRALWMGSPGRNRR